MFRFVSIFVTFYLTLLLFSYSYSQSDYHNSNIYFEQISNPKEKVDSIISFLENPYNQSIANYLDLIELAFAISDKNDYHFGKVKSMLLLGNYFYKDSNLKMAMEYVQKSLKLSENLDYKTETAYAYNLLGLIFLDLNDYENSSKYLFKSLKIFEKLTDENGLATIYGNIGKYNLTLNNLEKAKYYFYTSTFYAQKSNNLIELKKQYNNLGIIYSDLQIIDSAIFFINKAMEINKKINDKKGIALNLMNIGVIKLRENNLEETLPLFKEALTMFKELDDSLQISKIYLNIGYYYYFVKDLPKSIKYLDSCYNISFTSKQFEILGNCSWLLKTIYLSQNDTVKAYKYLETENIALDSIYRNKNQTIIDNYEIQYIYEKKEYELIIKQKTTKIVLISIILVSILGIIILYSLLSRNKIKSKLVKLQKDKLESELNLKNKEISIIILALIKKKELIAEITKKMLNLYKSMKNDESKNYILSIVNDLKLIDNNDMLDEFSIRFNEIHAGFYEKLYKKFPNLTQNELKLCAYLRLNMSTKEISNITNQSTATIDQARYRLRKKLQLPPNENLSIFLILSQKVCKVS